MYPNAPLARQGGPQPRRVVVYHQGALGDFLLVLSALAGLHAAHPAVRFDFWSKQEHFALVRAREYTGAFHPADCPEAAALLHHRLWEGCGLPAIVTGADALLIFGQSGSRVLAERLARRLSCPVCWVKSFPGDGDPPVHASELVRMQLRECGWRLLPIAARVVPAPEESEAARRWLRENGIHTAPAFIHPGSGGRRKIWPLAEWRGLIRWLAAAHSLPVILSLGPADDSLKEFSEAVGSSGVRVLSGCSLPRLSALLSESLFYVGSDSGVSHLAAACGAPAAVVFGPTDPAVWRPLGEKTHIVRKTWREEDVCSWSPESPPGPPDPDLVAIIESMLATS